jgi:hypothetical protein
VFSLKNRKVFVKKSLDGLKLLIICDLAFNEISRIYKMVKNFAIACVLIYISLHARSVYFHKVTDYVLYLVLVGQARPQDNFKFMKHNKLKNKRNILTELTRPRLLKIVIFFKGG